MPATNPNHVFDKLFRPMRNLSPEEDGLIVYREGTLDDRTMETCSHHTALRHPGHQLPQPRLPPQAGRGNCHDEGCGSAMCPAAAGYDSSFPVVVLKDICPNLIGGR
jgi:hypothetical protein